MVDALPRIASAFDEPFGNSSAVGVFHCARMAAEQGVPVLLAGDGGDELFGGSDEYVLMQKFDLYSRLPRSARRALELALGAMPGGSRLSLVRRARSYVTRASVPMPARMRTYEFLTPETCRDVFTSEFLGRVDVNGPVLTMDPIYARTDSTDVLQRQLHFALHTIIAENDLRKVRRMCGSAGVEARFPLLDDRVIAFAARIPPNVLVPHYHAREFYRRSLRDFLPRAIIAKEKHCFAHPVADWLAAPTPLRAVAGDLLREFAGRGIVRREYVRTLLDDRRVIGTPHHAALAWYMLVLEHWLRARGVTAWS